MKRTLAGLAALSLLTLSLPLHGQQLPPPPMPFGDEEVDLPPIEPLQLNGAQDLPIPDSPTPIVPVGNIPAPKPAENVPGIDLPPPVAPLPAQTQEIPPPAPASATPEPLMAAPTPVNPLPMEMPELPVLPMPDMGLQTTQTMPTVDLPPIEPLPMDTAKPVEPALPPVEAPQLDTAMPAPAPLPPLPPLNMPEIPPPPGLTGSATKNSTPPVVTEKEPVKPATETAKEEPKKEEPKEQAKTEETKPEGKKKVGSIKRRTSPKQFTFKNQRLPQEIYKYEYSQQNRHLPKRQTETDYDRLLFIAAAHNNINGVRALLNAGRHIEMRNEVGETPLMVAVRYGASGTTRLLIARGANPYARNQWGQSAMDYAAQSGRQDLMQAMQLSMR